MTSPTVEITLPAWTGEAVNWERAYTTDEDKMALAVALSRENVERETGGPFGAAIFEEATGRLVSVGVNRVVPLTCSVLHGEIVAFMMAQQTLGSFSLAAEGLPTHVLATSCEPCAMCLGATLWSGVKRVISGATREDAERLGFDEGPVFTQSFEYLKARGIAFSHGVLRQQAVDVLEAYRAGAGQVYNA
ncbi:nucleoside deaminase [soil metagenome]